MAERDPDDAMPMMFPSELARVGPSGGQPTEPAAAPPSGGFALRVTRRSNPAVPAQVHVLRQQSVVIGRSSSCDLQLDDQQRVASSRHAEIRLAQGRSQVVDLGSKNLTYLNGQPLEAGRPRELARGDVIEIADFSITVDFAAAEPPAAEISPAELSDQTVFAADFVNPFTEDSQRLAELLAGLSARWAAEPVGRRDSALEEALDAALDAALAGERSAFLGIVGRRLSHRTGGS